MGGFDQSTKTEIDELVPNALQRTADVGEVLSAENKYARAMITVEWGIDVWTARISRIVCVGKPHGKVTHLDGSIGVGESKGLVTEDADDISNAASLLIRMDLSLVPTEAEGSGRVLRDKECEIIVQREPGHFDMHILHWPEIADCDASACVNCKTSSARSTHHVEGEIILCRGARQHAAHYCRPHQNQGE